MMAMTYWHFLFAALAAFGFSFGLARYMTQPGSLGFVLDEPNHRSMHSTPTPRSGGLGFVIVLLLMGTLMAVRGSLDGAWVPAALLLAGVSYADDRGGLSVRWRLIAHLLAAGLLCLSARDLLPGLVPFLGLAGGAVVAFLATVWLINLYNFMDGMDGFAGGMAVFGFGALALAGWRLGLVEFAGFNTVLACAVLGFLCFNFPPARIFMGDVGSAVLGFAVAVVGFWGLRQGIHWSVPAAAFAPFWVDATLTLIKRTRRGEKIWVAHADHYYQQLVRAGWPKRRVVLGEYALMAVSGLAALGLALQPAWSWPIVAGLAVVYLGLLALCHGRWLRARR